MSMLASTKEQISFTKIMEESYFAQRIMGEKRRLFQLVTAETQAENNHTRLQHAISFGK